MSVSLIIDGIRVRDQRLEVDYVLTNADTRDLYVYNLVDDQFAQLGARSDIPRDQLVQACRGAPGELVMLLGVPNAPNYGPAFMSFAPLFPRCRKLEAGRSYAAKLRAPLPLAEWTLYTGPERSGPDVTREPISSLRLIAEHVFADEAYHAAPDAAAPLAWQVRSNVERHRVEVGASLAELGLELCVNAKLLRFRV
ncbi:hypothetical protein ACNOYE_25075 [Nannocystaceae bacterium ST9]